MGTGEDVGGQIATCNMTHVQRPIGVWPGDADKYTLGQMKCPYLFRIQSKYNWERLLAMINPQTIMPERESNESILAHAGERWGVLPSA